MRTRAAEDRAARSLGGGGQCREARASPPGLPSPGHGRTEPGHVGLSEVHLTTSGPKPPVRVSAHPALPCPAARSPCPSQPPLSLALEVLFPLDQRVPPPPLPTLWRWHPAGHDPTRLPCLPARLPRSRSRGCSPCCAWPAHRGPSRAPAPRALAHGCPALNGSPGKEGGSSGTGRGAGQGSDSPVTACDSHVQVSSSSIKPTPGPETAVLGEACPLRSGALRWGSTWFGFQERRSEEGLGPRAAHREGGRGLRGCWPNHPPRASPPPPCRPRGQGLSGS